MDLLCSRRWLEQFMLIAGIFCLGFGLVQLGRYEAYERPLGRNTFVGVVQAAGKPVVMEIPRLGLSVKVLEGDGEKNLALGAAHLTDTAALGSLNGNAGIAGHRDMAFRGLGSIRVGDEIWIHGAAEFRYRVTGTRIVKASDTSVLADDGRGRLTLITCYPFHYVGSAPQRFVVQAELQ